MAAFEKQVEREEQEGSKRRCHLVQKQVGLERWLSSFSGSSCIGIKSSSLLFILLLVVAIIDGIRGPHVPKATLYLAAQA